MTACMKKWEKAVVGGALFVIAILSTYLFYNQAIGRFGSDLKDHLDYALLTGVARYSVSGFLYRFIYTYLGKEFGIAVFLSVVVILTVFLTYKLLRFFDGGERKFISACTAIALNFVIAIFIPLVSEHLNMGAQEPSVWHNSTYILMKLLGLICIWLFLEIEKKYLKGIKLHFWLIFLICLTLTNLTKPNFILAFAPAMLVILIIDFFKVLFTKGTKKPIINMFAFGLAVLISLSVLWYQNMVLYSSDPDSSIVISFMENFSLYSKYPYISLLRSVIFPVFVLITNFKTVISDRKHYFMWLTWLFGLAEAMLLIEDGARRTHGNFEWGYNFTIMLIFISSVSIINKLRREGSRSRAYIIVAYALLALHLICGMVLFGKVVLGYTYW